MDFDGDGDLDVLAGTPFTAHALAPLAGAHRALAVDRDADGDLDVVAAAMIALAREGVERTLPSVVWLERTGPKAFTRHTLEVGVPTHASLDAADYDGDGDIDLVIGNLSPQRPVPTWVEVWENKTKTR